MLDEATKSQQSEICVSENAALKAAGGSYHLLSILGLAKALRVNRGTLAAVLKAKCVPTYVVGKHRKYLMVDVLEALRQDVGSRSSSLKIKYAQLGNLPGQRDTR